MLPCNVMQRQLDFLQLAPLELARQLCIVMHSRFQALRTGDFLDKAHYSGGNGQIAGLSDLIDMFNRVSYWTASEIVGAANLDMRVTVLERLLELGAHLLTLHNLHAAMAVFSGLSMGAVQRLRNTWARVGKRATETYRRFETLVSGCLHLLSDCVC